MRGICILSILLGASVADAQPLPRAEDKAEADRLFEEGRQLLADGKRAEACQKFDLSIRKDPRAVGTMLNLGLCREETGQVATAVRYYQEARDRAHDQGLSEHQQAAERKLALLAPRVPHLKIVLPADVPPRAKIVVDDMVVASDSTEDIQLDPGTHAITVTAPDKLPFEAKVTLAEAQHATISVSALAGAKTVVIREQSSRRALWGKIMVAGGVAALGGGIGLAYLARGQYWDQFPAGSRDGLAVMDTEHDCWTAIDGSKIVRQCNARGHDATTSAKRLSTIGIITAVAGGALAATGAVLWITAPSPSETPALTFDVHPDGALFAFTRAF